MENLLSREAFWTEKTLLADFLKEPLNEKLYEVYMNLKRKTPQQDFQTLQLFNEVYYICSRVVLEDNPRAELKDYIKLIKDDMGWDYPSSMVVNMVYVVLSLRRRNTETVNRLIEQIRHHYKMDIYHSPFSLFVDACLQRGEQYDIRFELQPLKLANIKTFEKLIKRNSTPIIQVQHAEINVNSPGNFITNKLQYGKQREE